LHCSKIQLCSSVSEFAVYCPADGHLRARTG
jgi:hypothetical protein